MARSTSRRPRAAAAPLLDLTTFTTRPLVRIDARTYELRRLDELSPIDGERLARHGDRLRAQMRAVKRGRTPDGRAKDWAAAAEILAAMVDQILLAPPAVRRRLRDSHRLAIVQAFTGLLPAGGAGGSHGRRRRRRRSTGGNSAPGSATSTAVGP